MVKRPRMAHITLTNIISRYLWLLILAHVSNGLSLGSISGDLKRTSGPTSIWKTSYHSPVRINIKSAVPTVFPHVLTPQCSNRSPVKGKKRSVKTKPVCLRKLLKLPKSLKLPKLPKLRSKPKVPKLPKIPKMPKLKKLPKIPKIPKLPLLPYIRPLLPPIIPTLPLLPLIPLLPILPPLPLLPPILPKLPKIAKLKPVRIPIIDKSGLRALGSEIAPIRVPAPNLKINMLEKLLKLRKDGSLTMPEFKRFKKLLLL